MLFCIVGFDVGIVLDKLKSVKNFNLVKVIIFLGELIGKFYFVLDVDYFGFIIFYNKVNLVFVFFNLDYYDKDILIVKIVSELIKLEFEICIDLVLIMVRDELFS